MAFTGDLQNLHIVDIIQLVHTTRKSGIFSVKGGKGESSIVFSNGYIVGANHLNNTVRIGTVLVKMGAITVEDLKQALAVSKDTAKESEPLLGTLIRMGKLKREDALRGLKKLVELTIVELMSWTKGTFTFDTDAVIFSSVGEATSGDTGPDVVLDAQMVLMDGLRTSFPKNAPAERKEGLRRSPPMFSDLQILTGLRKRYPGLFLIWRSSTRSRSIARRSRNCSEAFLPKSRRHLFPS
jgi:hypothetical protein